MGYVSARKIKDTLANTTQLVMLEEDNPSYATMKRTYKRDTHSLTVDILMTWHMLT